MATADRTVDQNTVVEEIFIAAAPARVFEAITDPKQMPQWWGRQGIYRILESRTDLRPGGKWSSAGKRADGTAFTIDGEYLEVDSPRLLVQTWNSSWGSGPSVVRWELEATTVHALHPGGPRKAGTGTVITMSQRHQRVDLPTMMAGNAEGWKCVLGWLNDYLENGDTANGAPSDFLKQDEN
jgi:uncharacterized protein YndB with AHSA1/START domain